MLFIGTAVYLLRSIAVGLYLLPFIQPVADWLLSVPNVGTTRAGIIVAAIGALILTIRVYGGKETSLEEMME
jgi:hypothetical protein